MQLELALDSLLARERWILLELSLLVYSWDKDRHSLMELDKSRYKYFPSGVFMGLGQVQFGAGQIQYKYFPCWCIHGIRTRTNPGIKIFFKK